MTRGKKVLVVDNGLELIEVAQKAAELSAWELTTASKAGEAVEKALSEKPEVIILGYLEPRGEAFRLHRWLRENPKTGDIPQVIVDVARSEQLAKGWRKDEGLKMDAEQYLCLPLGPHELGTVIDGVTAITEVLDVV